MSFNTTSSQSTENGFGIRYTPHRLDISSGEQFLLHSLGSEILEIGEVSIVGIESSGHCDSLSKDAEQQGADWNLNPAD